MGTRKLSVNPVISEDSEDGPQVPHWPRSTHNANKIIPVSLYWPHYSSVFVIAGRGVNIHGALYKDTHVTAQVTWPPTQSTTADQRGTNGTTLLFLLSKINEKHGQPNFSLAFEKYTKSLGQFYSISPSKLEKAYADVSYKTNGTTKPGARM